MQGEESKAAILKRIYSRLPPTRQKENFTAVQAVSDGEPFQMMSFEFTEATDDKGQSFITTPYTQGEQDESTFRYASLTRSPYSQLYVPGNLQDAVPGADHPTFQQIEKIVPSTHAAQQHHADLPPTLLRDRHR